LPAVQLKQKLAPADCTAVPAGQEEHCSSLVEAAKVPGAHCAQMDCPPKEVALPALQPPHSD
jgi:hypothetical protein